MSNKQTGIEPAASGPGLGRGGYLPPTGAELRALLRRWELTGAVAAELIQCHPRTIRKWVGDERPMPFAALYTLAHRSRGIAVQPATWRTEANGKPIETEVVPRGTLEGTP